jgi:alpha-ketoglutarate-dependent taurine dioxygenase
MVVDESGLPAQLGYLLDTSNSENHITRRSATVTKRDNHDPQCSPVIRGARRRGTGHRLVRSEYRFGNLWHTDFTNLPRPSLANALYSIEVPTHGGDTLIASTCAAFEGLSEGMKEMLRGLNAVHGFSEKYKRDLADQTERNAGVARNDNDSSEYLDAELEVVHPVVRSHPASGRESLSVNGGFTLRFKDMTPEESQPLLNLLYRHCERPFPWLAIIMVRRATVARARGDGDSS